MKIILMEDVPKLGSRGAVCDVARGYARNFLLPKKLALPATAANLQNLDHLQRQREREETKARGHAEVAADRIAGLTMTVTTRASDDGRLYGSVGVQDIVDFLERHGVPVEKRRVLLEEPIKVVGEYRIVIRLHAGVTAELPVVVMGA